MKWLCSFLPFKRKEYQESIHFINLLVQKETPTIGKKSVFGIWIWKREVQLQFTSLVTTSLCLFVRLGRKWVLRLDVSYTYFLASCLVSRYAWQGQKRLPPLPSLTWPCIWLASLLPESWQNQEVLWEDCVLRKAGRRVGRSWEENVVNFLSNIRDQTIAIPSQTNSIVLYKACLWTHSKRSFRHSGDVWEGDLNL